MVESKRRANEGYSRRFRVRWLGEYFGSSMFSSNSWDIYTKVFLYVPLSSHLEKSTEFRLFYYCSICGSKKMSKAVWLDGRRSFRLIVLYVFDYQRISNCDWNKIVCRFGIKVSVSVLFYWLKLHLKPHTYSYKVLKSAALSFSIKLITYDIQTSVLLRSKFPCFIMPFCYTFAVNSTSTHRVHKMYSVRFTSSQNGHICCRNELHVGPFITLTFLPRLHVSFTETSELLTIACNLSLNRIGSSTHPCWTINTNKSKFPSNTHIGC